MFGYMKAKFISKMLFKYCSGNHRSKGLLAKESFCKLEKSYLSETKTPSDCRCICMAQNISALDAVDCFFTNNNASFAGAIFTSVRVVNQ